MIKKILVPLDGSALAERALEPALTLAQQDGGEVILLRVPVLDALAVSVGVYSAYTSAWQDPSVAPRNEAHDYLATIQAARAQPNFTLRTEVIEGDVATAIVDAAAAENVGLIVMSTHGYSGLTRWVLGSVTEKVLRDAPCPVLAVRSPDPIHHVLISLDGSELSERALEPGLEVAASLGAEVTLLRAVHDVSVEEVERLERVERGLGRRLQEEMYTEAENYLQGLEAAYPRAGSELQKVVKIGATADGILDFAAGHEVGLIVMATHGRTGLRRWVYGSVTEKVLRSAGCSMLIIRPAAHDLN